MRITAAGFGMGDYGRVYKDENGVEAVCTGYHRGPEGVFTRLTLKEEPYAELDCEFIPVHKGVAAWDTVDFTGKPCDWYAIEKYYWSSKDGSLLIKRKMYEERLRRQNVAWQRGYVDYLYHAENPYSTGAESELWWEGYHFAEKEGKRK